MLTSTVLYIKHTFTSTVFENTQPFPVECITTKIHSIIINQLFIFALKDAAYLWNGGTGQLAQKVEFNLEKDVFLFIYEMLNNSFYCLFCLVFVFQPVTSF